MIIYRFQIQHNNRIQNYQIESTMKSKGYRSGYTQTETWKLICEDDGQVIKTSYGRGINKIKKSIEELKEIADQFIELMPMQINPTAVKYSK